MRFFLAALIFAFSSYTAPALARDADIELAPLNLTARYNVYWNGLPIGRVRIKAEETSSRYQVSFDIKTRGIAELFSPMRSYSVAEGIKNVQGEYIPIRFTTESTDDGEKKRVEITYDSHGAISGSSRNPPETPGRRPVVSIEELAGAHDNISAFLIMRQQMMANIKAKVKDTTTRTFDSRRLAEFTFKVINPGTKMIHNKITGMINTVVFRKPINGYSEKELAKYDKGDPTVHVYFSQNGIFLPLMVESQVMFGTVRAIIDEETMPQLVPQTN